MYQKTYVFVCGRERIPGTIPLMTICIYTVPGSRRALSIYVYRASEFLTHTGTNGYARYDSVPEGRYVLKLTAKSKDGERDIVRRKIFVGKFTVRNYIINQCSMGYCVPE